MRSPLRSALSSAFENEAGRGNFSTAFARSPLRCECVPRLQSGVPCADLSPYSRVRTAPAAARTPAVLRRLEAELDDITTDLDAYVFESALKSDLKRDATSGTADEQGSCEVERAALDAYNGKLDEMRVVRDDLARVSSSRSRSRSSSGGTESSSTRGGSSSAVPRGTLSTMIGCAAACGMPSARSARSGERAAVAEEMLALLRARFTMKDAELAWTLRNCCCRLVRIAESAANLTASSPRCASPAHVRRERLAALCSALVGALHFAASVSAEGGGVHVAGQLQAAACEAISAHASEAGSDWEHPAADLLIDAAALPALVFVLRSEAGETQVLWEENVAGSEAHARAACSFAVEALQLLLLNSTRGARPLLRCGALGALCDVAAAPFRDADLTTRALEALMWTVRCAMERPDASAGAAGLARLDLGAVAEAACVDQRVVRSARARAAACDLTHATCEIACRWAHAAGSSEDSAPLLIRAASAASALLVAGARESAEAAATARGGEGGERLRQSAKRALSSLRRMETAVVLPRGVALHSAARRASRHGRGPVLPALRAADAPTSVGCVLGFAEQHVAGCVVM